LTALVLAPPLLMGILQPGRHPLVEQEQANGGYNEAQDGGSWICVTGRLPWSHPSSQPSWH
jgi:hypothetical protein